MASFRSRPPYPGGRVKTQTIQDRQLTKETSGDTFRKKEKYRKDESTEPKNG